MSQILQSVAQALRVIQLLQNEADLGVTEVATRLGIGTSTAHRLLATLLEFHFVEQLDSARRYRLGPAMSLSGDAAAIEHCIEAGYSVMEHLRDESSETVHISVLNGTEAKFVAVIESRRMVRVTSRVGVSIPSHTAASGKILLAELSDEELNALYPDEELPGGTGRGLRTRTGLKHELALVREQGYARNLGESEEGLAAIAMGIRRPSGRTVACLTLTGPLSRFNPVATGSFTAEPSARELEFLHMLTEHVAQIERVLLF